MDDVARPRVGLRSDIGGDIDEESEHPTHIPRLNHTHRFQQTLRRLNDDILRKLQHDIGIPALPHLSLSNGDATSQATANSTMHTGMTTDGKTTGSGQWLTDM